MITKKRILLVDGDPGIQRWLGSVLRSEGYETKGASGKEAALHILAVEQIDFVLLDLDLPDDNAWEIYGELISYDPFLPVIITGRYDQFELASLAGAGALVEKPLDFDLLLRTIRDLQEEGPDQRLKRLVGTGDLMRFVPAINQ